jgi:translation initiation factor 1 (eIF-1/SUI1)
MTAGGVADVPQIPAANVGVAGEMAGSGIPPPPPASKSVEETGEIAQFVDHSQLLQASLLNLVAYTSNKTLRLPTPVSTFYASHILPILRAQGGGDRFELKRTEWKKLQPFLKAQQFMTIRAAPQHGQVVDMVSAIDRSHPLIRAYKREHDCLIDKPVEEDTRFLKMVELYVFPPSVASAVGLVAEDITANASTVERRGTKFLTKTEALGALKTFMESKNVDTRGGVVLVDGPGHPLAGLLPMQEFSVKDLQARFLGLSKSAIAITVKEGGTTRVASMKMGKKSSAIIRCFRRGGNKHITVVEHIGNYAKTLGVTVESIAEEIKLKVACSTSVDEESKITCGGKVFKEVWEVLTKSKTKYNLMRGGLTSGSWKFGTEVITVQLQKGIKG